MNTSKKGAIGAKKPLLEAIAGARVFSKNPCNLSFPMLNLPLRKAVLKRVSEWVKIIKFVLHKPKKGQINECGNCFLELSEEKMPDSIELLNTTGLDHEIGKMFREEKDSIFILSPYLDLTLELQTILETSPAKIVIIWRDETIEEDKKDKKDDYQYQINKISGYKKSMPRVDFFGLPYLHSKAYITSGSLIITSLNLYKKSLDNNFELGILLKKTSYNKIILELYEELKLLFTLNKNIIDINLQDYLKLPTIDDLFKEIQNKSGKHENDFGDAELLKQFSKPMMRKFNFTNEEKWKKDGEKEYILQRKTKIRNRDMYEWALKNIRL